MKKIIIILICVFYAGKNFGQITTEIADVNFKVIQIGNHGKYSYSKSVILLHEIYNGTVINKNYAIGTITAMRGGTSYLDRTNIININTSSGYKNVNGSFNSINTDDEWKLVTVFYNSKKYMAVLVPYGAAFHQLGFQFKGWTLSTAEENMKIIAYENNGAIINEEIANSITPFSPNMTETHDASKTIFNGNVAIGGISDTEGFQLAVAGTEGVIAEKVSIKLYDDGNGWPDYVFTNGYKLPTLKEVEKHIDKKGHLENIPSAKEIQEKGSFELGEMNKKLLQKIEELTLYTIQQEKEILNLKQKFEKFEKLLENQNK